MTVTIGGRDITDLLIGNLSWPVGGLDSDIDGHLQIRADPERIRMIDWTQWLVVRGRVGETDTNLFSGFVDSTTRSTQSNDLQVQFADPRLLLEESYAGGAFGSGFHPSEVLYYLLASVTPDLVSPETIAYDDKSALADKTQLFLPRLYTFISPLPFLRAPDEPVNFLDGIVYRGAADASVDDRVISAAFKDHPVAAWGEGQSRIRFVLQAAGFLDAFEKGRDRLRKALDVMSLAANFSSPTMAMSSEQHLLEFSRQRLNLALTEPDWLYVRDNFPGIQNRHWIRWYSRHIRSDALSLENDSHFDAFERAFRRLATKSADRLESRERALLSAMHAMRRSRQAAYESDSLSLMWQAMEYLVAGFPAPIPVSKRTSATILKKSIQELKAIETNVTTDELLLMEKHVRRGMNLVRSLPLKDKWDYLCSSLNLDFTDEEQNLLWALRKSRNDDLHGSTSSVRRIDILRALVMLEKAAVGALAKWA